MSVWSFAEEQTPTEAEPVRDLWSWGLNYLDRPNPGNPWTLFLDLIGWTEDELGDTRLSCWSGESLGWIEVEYLADALRAYIAHPEIVRAWVNGLVASEIDRD